VKTIKITPLLVVIFFFQLTSQAQTAAKDAKPSSVDTQTINEIDALLKQNGGDEQPEASTEIINRPMTRKEIKKLNVSDYSKIVSDTAYEDYSVVQRNYMPKSSRLQVKTGITTVTNDVFYTNIGLNLSAIYNFTEAWGVGINAALLNSTRNSDAQNIRDVQSVNIENLVTLKNSYGANVYFSPFYGKWSLLNRKILPFEIYFTGGLAQVSNQDGLQSSAVSGGLGQLVSLSRSSAFDVNIQWLFYSTKNINNQDQNNNSMLLTVGYSVFWPKPDYR
jgi:outer membrane beta-barrel protein